MHWQWVEGESHLIIPGCNSPCGLTICNTPAQTCGQEHCQHQSISVPVHFQMSHLMDFFLGSWGTCSVKASPPSTASRPEKALPARARAAMGASHLVASCMTNASAVRRSGDQAARVASSSSASSACSLPAQQPG